MRKAILTVFLTALAAFEVRAANVTASGNDCGENCTWTFYDDGTMVISGQGAMYDWDSEVGRWNLPWKGLGMTNVVVEDGITSVGGNSFFQCGTIQNITLAPSVEIVGIGAFDEDTWVQNVTMSDSTVWLDQDDFDNYGGTSQISLNCYGDMDICQVNFSNTPKTPIESTVGCATSNCTHILSDMMHDGYCTSLRACKTLDDMKNDGQYCNTYQACQTLVETTTQGQYCNTYETCKTLIDLANAGQYCTNLENCKALSDMAATGEYCDSLESCKALSDMAATGEYCDSLESCKALSDMASMGEYCDSLESCKALSDMAASGEYCDSLESCKALSDLVGGENCDSLESCKTLSDMAASGEYCSTVEECKRFMDLMNSGYCEGFEACKEMFNASVINYDGKRYGSLEDLYNGNALPSITRQEQGDGSFAVYKDGVFAGYKGKRIYTMEEANRVTKPMGNTLKIKYR